MKKVGFIRLSFLVFAFVLITMEIFAQDSTWTVFNKDNSGLPGNEVNAMAIDDNGNKWFGTVFDGAAKYDGSNWEVFNTANSELPDNYINAITIDQSGSIWFATENGGAAKFDGTSWEVFNPSNSGLPTSSIKSVASDGGGAIWFGTFAGAAKYDGTNWEVFNTVSSGLPNNFVYSIAIEQNGDIWFGTYGGGLAKYDGTSWEVFNIQNSGIPYNYITCVEIDPGGNKWIGTYGGGASKYNGTEWEVFQTSNSGIPNNYIYAVGLESGGIAWFGTSTGGVGKYDGTNWEVFNTSNSSLPYDVVTAIVIDEAKDKWFATSGAGVARYAELIIPVELTEFTARIIEDKVQLNWATASETNNEGFAIMRSIDGKKYSQIGFVPGSGTTAEYHNYSFVDESVTGSKTYYKLRQIDFDGSLNDSKTLEVGFIPEVFILKQNYPNPFNPETVISFTLPVDASVIITFYNLAGSKIEEFAAKEYCAGNHYLNFNGSNLSSGIYLYKLSARGEDGRTFNDSRKMMLLK